MVVNGFSECVFTQCVITLENDFSNPLFWAVFNQTWEKAWANALDGVSILQCLSALWVAEGNLREALEFEDWLLYREKWQFLWVREDSLER